MPTFSQIANGEAHVKTTWGTLTVNITYYPAHVTEKTIAEFRSFDMDDPVAGFGMVNDLLIDLIAKWDLTENDGVTMYPLVADRLASLPLKFRAQCLRDIMRDIRPEDETAQS